MRQSAHGRRIQELHSILQVNTHDSRCLHEGDEIRTIFQMTLDKKRSRVPACSVTTAPSSPCLRSQTYARANPQCKNLPHESRVILEEEPQRFEYSLRRVPARLCGSVSKCSAVPGRRVEVEPDVAGVGGALLDDSDHRAGHACLQGCQKSHCNKIQKVPTVLHAVSVVFTCCFIPHLARRPPPALGVGAFLHGCEHSQPHRLARPQLHAVPPPPTSRCRCDLTTLVVHQQQAL